MPCNQIRETAVDLSVADIDTLLEGLKQAEYSTNEAYGQINIFDSLGKLLGRIERATKKIYYRGSISTGEEQRRSAILTEAYSRGVVVSQARKHGWKLTEKKSKSGNVLFEVER